MLVMSMLVGISMTCEQLCFLFLIFRIKIVVVGLWVSGQLVVKRRVYHLSIGPIHGSNDQ